MKKNMKNNSNSTALRITSYALLLLLLWVSAACSKNENETPTPPTAHEIGFRADGMAPATRSTSEFADGAMFGVLAYTCPTGAFDDITDLPDLLYNAQVEKYTSESVAGYRYIPTAHWPAGTATKVQFAAYYPHSSTIAAGAITVSPFTSPGLPKIQVVMGLEKGSIDFATSVVGPIRRVFTAIDAANPPSVPANDPAGTPARTTDYVNFHFTRHMSYLSFRGKTTELNPSLYRVFINSISLRNIYRRGTFNLKSQAWEATGIDATTGATLKVASNAVPVSSTAFKDIGNPGGTTMLSVIPQTYDNVELTVSYTLEYLIEGCEHLVTGTKMVPLTVDWTPGKQHVYDLEFSFSEVYGEEALFGFNVQSWKTIDVDIDM